LTSLLSTVTGLAHVLLEDINSPEPIDTNVYQVPITVDPVHSTRSGPRDFIMSTVNAVNADGSRKYQLDIQLNTLATRIRFDRSASTPRAIGVEFVQGTSLYSADPRYTGAIGTAGYVAAKKEVIISAGAFNTPQLLKLSGVGPREELSKFGIEVVKDLPGVGTNLQDRYEVGVIGKSNRGGFVVKKGCTFGYTSPDPCLRDWQTGQSVAARGAYGSSGFAVAVPRRSSTLASNDDPDTFVFGTPVKFAGYYPGFARDAVNVNGYWSWLTLKARSHNNAGTVMLRSTNPRDTPLITFNYFDTGNTADDGDEKDLQASYEAIMFARKMYSDVIPLDGSFTEIIPGKRVQTEAQVKQWIKDEAWGHHASCTCPIGADNDPMAVLDSEFRVRGVDALRVVDASVFPKIPGFFISVPIYMVSEKAAAVIIGTQ
jgi:choline dehydrogenase